MSLAFALSLIGRLPVVFGWNSSLQGWPVSSFLRRMEGRRAAFLRVSSPLLAPGYDLPLWSEGWPAAQGKVQGDGWRGSGSYRALFPPGDGCSHPGDSLGWNLGGVCVCWFPDRKLFFYTPQSIPVLIIYMGLWDRAGNSGHPYQGWGWRLQQIT